MTKEKLKYYMDMDYPYDIRKLIKEELCFGSFLINPCERSSEI